MPQSPSQINAKTDSIASPKRTGIPYENFPLWFLCLLFGVVLFAWKVSGDADYSLIFSRLSSGIVTTIRVSLISFVLAFFLGLLLVTLKRSRWYLVRQFTTLYIEIMRGLPMLVLLYYIALAGAPQLISLYNWVISPLVAMGLLESVTIRDFSFEFRAIMALTLGYSAFISEILRAGIESVDKGQTEAAYALGLSRWKTFKLVIWPQAVRVVLPPLVNDFVSMIKDSSLVSVFGVADITQLGKVYASGTFLFFETWNVVAFMYLMLTITLSLFARLLERYFKRNDHGVND